jgi:hypothetical protein
VHLSSEIYVMQFNIIVINININLIREYVVENENHNININLIREYVVENENHGYSHHGSDCQIQRS